MPASSGAETMASLKNALVHADLDGDPREGLADRLNTGQDELSGPVRVVDVAGAVEDVQHLAGLGAGVTAGCECWNCDADDDVDQDDFAQFLKCVTGPSIPFDPGNPPAGCLP